MANVINRITKQYLKSVNTPDYPELDWIINPVFIPKCDIKYMVVEGDTVREMTIGEKAVIDYVAPPPEPTLGEAKVTKQNTIKQECTRHILKAYPDNIQRSAALGIYSIEVITEMTNFIVECIAEENRCYDAIEIAVTIEDVNLVTPSFPQ